MFEYITYNNRIVGLKLDDWCYILDKEYTIIYNKNRGVILGSSWSLQSIPDIKFIYPENQSTESIVFNKFLKLNNITDPDLIKHHYHIFNNMIKTILLNGNKKYLKLARKFPIKYRYYIYKLCCLYENDRMYNNLVKCPQLALESSEYNKFYVKTSYPNLYIQPKNIDIYNDILKLSKYMKYDLNIYEPFINCKHQTIMIKIIKLLQIYHTADNNLTFLNYIQSNILLLKNRLRKDINILDIVFLIYDIFNKDKNIIQKEINVLIDHIEIKNICSN